MRPRPEAPAPAPRQDNERVLLHAIYRAASRLRDRAGGDTDPQLLQALKIYEAWAAAQPGAGHGQ
jgi:hypothetical protein